VLDSGALVASASSSSSGAAAAAAASATAATSGGARQQHHTLAVRLLNMIMCSILRWSSRCFQCQYQNE